MTPEDAALFAIALDRVKRDNGRRHSLEEVMHELDSMREQSPEATSAASTEGDDR